MYTMGTFTYPLLFSDTKTRWENNCRTKQQPGETARCVLVSAGSAILCAAATANDQSAEADGRHSARCMGVGCVCGQTAICSRKETCLQAQAKVNLFNFPLWSSLTPSKRRTGWSSCGLQAPHKLPSDHEKELWVVFGTRDVAGHPEQASC